jgi:chromosome segregation ATPase
MAPLLHTAAADLAKTPPASTGSARGSDGFEALHAVLDSRLAALEAALADPNETALEGLILDLARAATQEAEAMARRASAQARAEADAQAGNALSQAQIAEAALASERHAGLELHRSLGAARSELEAAKQKATAAAQELERLRESFSIERTTLRGELSEAERCFAAADTRRQQVEEARDEEVARERATAQRLTDALAKARGEIDAARQDVTSRAADMEAARERADNAARSLADLNQSLNEARARADTVSQERDRLKADLEVARQSAVASATAIQSAATERTGVEQKWHEAEARATTIMGERDRLAGERDRLTDERDRLTGERDRLAGEKDRLATEKERLASERDRLIADRDRLTRDREAVSAQLETARQGATTAAAAAQAIETQRAALEQTLHEVEASNDTGLREVEARIEVIVRQHAEIVAERDAALDARDALVAERDAANARREAAEAERNAAVAQLEAARQGSTTANAAIQSLDAHRATLEHNWQSAEARAEALTRERDAAVAQRDAAVAERADAVANADALRKAVDNAQETSRARFSELRQRTERQIQDLEAQLLGAGEDGPEIDVSLDAGDDAGAAIEIEAMEPDEPIVASKPSREAHTAPAASFSPSRVASRHGFREPLEVKLDGQTALLIDISTSGAQVLSSGTLKPNKPVKMLLPSTGAILLCQAKIVWSRFEPPTPGKPMRYRAGMVFTQADAAGLQGFITRHSGVKLGLGAAVGAPLTTEERKTGRLISVPFNSATGTGKNRRAEPRDPMSSIDFDFPAKQRRE